MPSNQVTTEVSIKLRKWPMSTLLIGRGSYPEVFFTWDLYPKKLVGICRKMSNFNMDCSKFKGMANESCESIIVETWKRIIGKKLPAILKVLDFQPMIWDPNKFPKTWGGSLILDRKLIAKKTLGIGNGTKPALVESWFEIFGYTSIWRIPESFRKVGF